MYDDDELEDRGQIRRRLRLLLLGFAALVCGFFLILYNLQLAHGEEYLETIQHTIPRTETVSAARGSLVDSMGRVLVSNRISYQVTFDASMLGAGAQRSGTLRELLAICRAQGVEWEDTLPVTASAPFQYTVASPFLDVSTDEEGNETRTLTQLGRLAVKMNWLSGNPEEKEDVELPSAAELMERMCKDFSLDGTDWAEDRAVAGVIYELVLRSQDINRSAYVFAENVEIPFISAVKEHGLVGVNFEAVSVREYHTSYAAHLLGRVGPIYSEEWPEYQEMGYSMNAVVGKDGFERAFEQYLRGVSGTRVIETNTSGKVVNETWKTDPETGETLTPKPGYNVVTTLNSQLQERVERALAETIPTLPEAEGGAAVVLDVNTAAVLAMASYPTFDLVHFNEVWSTIQDDPSAPMLNRAIQGQYPPGSTFKMVTAVGALEEGIITPAEKILDTGVYTYYTDNADQAPQCWIYRQNKTTHGLLNVTDAITVSCNVFFYDVGRRLGIEKLNEYARKFGLGEPTGIELDEKTGVVAGPDYTEGVLHQPWYEGSTLSAAIGQENNQFTPLQLANYVATLVNGGNHHAAHLLKEVKSSDFSEVVYRYEPELLDTIEIAPENLEAVKQGMLAVTESGSVAKYFENLDVKVGAKTGSAQVSSSTTSNAVFVAFAPYDDPQIALCIVVEKGGSGSELGAVAADIISYYFSSESALGAEQGENTLIR